MAFRLSRIAGFFGLLLGFWALAAGSSRWLGPSAAEAALGNGLPWQVLLSTLALSAVLLTGAWRNLRHRGESAPRELPLLAAVIVIAASIGVSHAVATRDAHQQREASARHAGYLQLQIATQARIRIQALERMGADGSSGEVYRGHNGSTRRG